MSHQRGSVIVEVVLKRVIRPGGDSDFDQLLLAQELEEKINDRIGILCCKDLEEKEKDMKELTFEEADALRFSPTADEAHPSSLGKGRNWVELTPNAVSARGNKKGMLLSSTLLGSLSQNQQGYTTTGTPTRDKEGAEEADAPKRGPRRLSPDATPTATPTETPRPAKQQPQHTSVAGKGLPEVPLKKLAEKDAKKTRALPPTPSDPEIPPGPTQHRQQEVDDLKRALAESLKDNEDLKEKLAEMERAVLPTSSALAIPPGPTQKEVDHLKRALADAQQFINDVMDKQDTMDKRDLKEKPPEVPLKELAGKDAAKTRALPPTPSTPAMPPGPTQQEVDELKRALAEAFKDKQDLKQKLDEESNQNGLRKGDCIKALTHLNQEL
jgi:hypothetical protein